jgi:hypothetical protein
VLQTQAKLLYVSHKIFAFVLWAHDAIPKICIFKRIHGLQFSFITQEPLRVMSWSPEAGQCLGNVNTFLVPIQIS